MITFNKIVNKLSKQHGELLNLSDIGSILDPDFPANGKKHLKEVYKLIYRLKANKIIIPIKNSLYFVSNDSPIDPVDILDTYYWKIVKKIISDETGGKYLIGSKKALEMHLKDYSIHDKLIVYTKDIQKIVSITGKLKIHFKIFAGGKHSGNVSLNTLVSNFSDSITIEGRNFLIGNKEFSLLDSLLVSDRLDRIDDYLIKKYLLKYSNSLSRAALGRLVKMKYISSINRLRIKSKDLGHEELYSKCLDVIKVEGANCFLTL